MKAVIFDMDGTLVDTEIVWYKSWQLANKEFHLELSENILRSFIGMPKQTFDEVKEKIFSNKVDLEAISLFRQSYYDCYKKMIGIEVKSGVRRLLNYLRSENIRMAVCTSTFSDRTFTTLKDARLFDYFDVVVTGEDLVKGKPDPEIYYRTMKALDLTVDECIAIEDSCFGIMSAARAGLPTYFVKDINEIDEKCLSLVKKRFHTIDELIDEIKGEVRWQEKQ